MKKIPTLFERIYENHKVVGITPNVIPGMEWVLEGEGEATVKIDGSCCAIIDGNLFRRYDAKKGKKPPEGAVPCQDEPDPVTGHWPHWVECKEDEPADKWYLAAYQNSSVTVPLQDGTYEAVGPHFQGNPYNLDKDMLEAHGTAIIQVERTFEGIRKVLQKNCMEGIVFWKDGAPQCKIKRSDFGFPWPRRKVGEQVKRLTSKNQGAKWEKEVDI